MQITNPTVANAMERSVDDFVDAVVNCIEFDQERSLSCNEKATLSSVISSAVSSASLQLIKKGDRTSISKVLEADQKRIRYHYNDGGRSAAGYKGRTGDCVVRAIAIATDMAYQDVYESLTELNKAYANNHNDKVAKQLREKGLSPRNGVFKEVYNQYLNQIGWEYVSFGANRKLPTELPPGRLICRQNRHLIAMIDHTVHDAHDSRYTTFYGEPQLRKMIGYYKKRQ